MARAQKYTLSLDRTSLSYVFGTLKFNLKIGLFDEFALLDALQNCQKWRCTPQNLTRAVFPVAFKSIFTSAVVGSFGVATCSILVTLVFNRAFVNV